MRDEALFTIALLIDELKHEEATVRLESMKQLRMIADALGPDRTRVELIPFLTDSLDDDDDVLLVLAETLGTFVDAVGGASHAPSLLAPLESLAMVDEGTVRDKACASLIAVSKSMSDAAIQDKFAPIVRNMSEKDWFTARISACSLFAATYPHLNAATKAEFRGLFGKLCRDDTPMVRRSAAANLGPFAAAVEPENVRGELMPLFAGFAEDEQDSVRLLAVQGATQLAKMVGPEANKSTILPTCLALAQDKSWRVRWSVASGYCDLAEALGASAGGSSPLAGNKDFLDAFVSLLRDTEPEVRSASAKNVARMARLYPVSTLISTILPPVTELASDGSEFVREALAGVVMGLAPLVGKEKAQELLVPLYLQLLRDENAQVRLAIVAQLGQADGVVGVDALSAALLPAITQLSEDKNWRVRAKIIEQVSVLAATLSADYFDKNLLALSLGWLSDTVYAIRDVAAQNLRVLTQVFGKPWCEKKVIPEVQSLRDRQHYLYRLTAISAAEVLCGCLDKPVVDSTLVPLIISLAKDPVPNVRFGVAKALERIAKTNKAAVNGATFEACLKPMEKDADQDVVYFSKRALVAVKG